jgi:hypothetical protein
MFRSRFSHNLFHTRSVFHGGKQNVVVLATSEIPALSPIKDYILQYFFGRFVFIEFLSLLADMLTVGGVKLLVECSYPTNDEYYTFQAIDVRDEYYKSRRT